MSIKNVTFLRRAGRLDEAYEMAVADLQAKDDEWTRKAMFWVLRDYFEASYKNGDMESCRQKYNEMQEQMDNIQGEDDVMIKIMRQAANKLKPNYITLSDLEVQSKNGGEQEAYGKVMDMLRNQQLDEGSHEKVGWILYRYLNKHFSEIGSKSARGVLADYMQLNNPRPSLLHSQMLNVASKMSSCYSDFKFLTFLQMWNVNNFMERDFYNSYSTEGKTYAPLYQRLFQRCIEQGNGLDECLPVFEKNEKISRDDLLTVYCKEKYYEIYRLSQDKQQKDNAISVIKAYAEEIKGKMHANEYHSKIMNTLIFMRKELDRSDLKTIIENFGFDCFMPQDWERQENENDSKHQFPSLVEKFVKLYNCSLAAAQESTPDAAFEPLLKQAINRYPHDEHYTRYLAKAYKALGKTDLARNEYKKLLQIEVCRPSYLWRELADIADTHDLKVSALCKALLVGSKEEYVGEVRLRLADELIEDGLYSEALLELDTYEHTYKENNWHIKDDYKRIRNKLPLGIIATTSNTEFYRSHEKAADEYVYSEIPWTEMVVTHVNEVKTIDGKKAERVWLSSADGTTIYVTGSKYLDVKPVVGKCYDVKLGRGRKNRMRGLLIRESDRTVKDIFQEKVGVVNNVNEEKQLFHCAFGAQEDAIVYYEKTAIRPKLGDVVVAHCYVRLNDMGQKRLGIMDIEIDNERETNLIKDITGTIVIKVNGKGKRYGFVDHYYVPTSLLDGVEDECGVRITVIWNGDKWKTIGLTAI